MPLIYDVNTHPDTVRYYWQIRQRAASIVTSIPRARYYGTNRSILKKGGFSRTESVFSSFQSSLCIKRETRYVCEIRNCEWEILHMTLSWMETKRNWIFFFKRNRITSDSIFFFAFLIFRSAENDYYLHLRQFEGGKTVYYWSLPRETVQLWGRATQFWLQLTVNIMEL